MNYALETWGLLKKVYVLTARCGDDELPPRAFKTLDAAKQVAHQEHNAERDEPGESFLLWADVTGSAIEASDQLLTWRIMEAEVL